MHLGHTQTNMINRLALRAQVTGKTFAGRMFFRWFRKEPPKEVAPVSTLVLVLKGEKYQSLASRVCVTFSANESSEEIRTHLMELPSAVWSG